MCHYPKQQVKWFKNNRAEVFGCKRCYVERYNTIQQICFQLWEE